MTILNEVDLRKPLLDIQNLKKYFSTGGTLEKMKKNSNKIKAVDDVSFQLYEGETYGLVGESGCGKSTAGRAILRLTEPTMGKAIYNNQDIFQLSKRDYRDIRQDLQMVFQDPHSSLNPRMHIGNILEEPLAIHSIGHKNERTEKAMDILAKVGLRQEHYYRYPHEFSGGQRQRIGLARSLIINPKIVILDEPVSALDVSIQSQVLNLLNRLQKELKLTYLFISHDISVIRHVCDRVGVMYLGKIMEEAPTDNIFSSPMHPYTQALLSAVPKASLKQKQERIILKGDLPSPSSPPSGCVFHTRCPHAMEICKKKEPIKREIKDRHYVACHLYE